MLCGSKPNCVTSDAVDGAHQVSPFELAVAPGVAWPEIAAVVKNLPRVTIVSETENGLRAECRSRLFRFVDDLELRLRPENGVVAVRSCSRQGYSDLGVNRRRVERLRDSLRRLGIVH